jgi:phytoene/squalene synthetase
VRSAEAEARGGLDEALRHCERIALQGKNNLFRAAQFLTARTRYHLFTSTYASMRVIDDAVDVSFLGLSAGDRDRARPAALQVVDRWEEQVERAARGEFAADGSAFEPAIFEVLNRYLPASDLGVEPFRRLAAAMRHDVRETELATWEDFLAYCEGASVAPASVFIYILACRLEGGERTTLDLPEPPESYARAMARFCYCTHILRDLRKDAARSPQLLTIPRRLLREAGHDAASFSRAVLAGDLAGIAPVTRSFVTRAEEYAAEARRVLARLEGRLGMREHRILWTLFHWYWKTFESVREEYAAAL